MKFLRLLSLTVLLLSWTFTSKADPSFTFTHIGGGETGSLTKNSEGSYTFVGGGNDIWDASDEFDFAHVQVTGDFDVAVRVESLEPVARWTKAGIMVREELTGSSRKAWNRVTPGDVATGNGGNGANDTRFSYRTGRTGGAGSNDGQHEEGSGNPEYPNGWLRLQREGTVVRAYASADGATWRQQGAQDTATWGLNNTPLPATVYLGLAVSRHSGPDTLATAEFRDLQAPRIGAQPQNVTVPEGSAASFNIGLQGWGDWRVQWLEDGAEIAGATDRTYRIPATVSGQNGRRYSARATDVFSGQVFTTSEAMLTVIADTFAPTLVSAATPITPTPSGTEFSLVYSEIVNEADAENLANYSISGGATLMGAELQSDNKTVRFTTSDLYTPGCKVLTVNNVRDRAATPNSIVPNSQIAVITAQGSIRYHQYNGITGVTIPELTNNAKFPNFPDVVARPSLFENPGGGGEHADNYGVQMVGYLHPPVSGDYKFFIAADDNAVLYLSTDDNPANKVLLAREPDWAGFRNFISHGADDRGDVNANRGPVSNPANISAPVTLQGGCKYFVEFLFKEGGGGDYGSVAWQFPGSPVIQNGSLPIGGQFMSPYDVAATISGGPNDATVDEGTIVTFSARIEGSPSLTIQWYKNGAPIEGATGLSITVGPVVYPDDNGAQYHVVAQNSLGTATSRTATLTVVEDTTAPTIASAGASSTFNQVQVQFSEIMNGADIVDNFAYEITDPTGAALAINSITATGGDTGVLITINGAMAEDTVYTLAVVGVVRDFSDNPIADGTTASIRSFVSGCGGLLFEAYHNIGGNMVSLLTSDPDFPNNPNDRIVIGPVDSRAAYPDDSHEGYGARMSGVFVPPYSGNWILYLRSDDASELWFNPEGPSAAGKRKVAEELGCCRAFEAIPTAAMPLTGGQPYYLEVLYKEGGGGDYGQVAARIAGSSEALAPIPARDTGTFALAGSAGAISITRQPVDTIAEEGMLVTFSVQTENTHNLRACHQWQKGGVDIPGATGSTYTFRPALSENGDDYRVRVSIPGMTVLSTEATVTVNPDTTSPTVTSVSGTDSLQNVIVTFSELINADDGADEFLYTVTDASGGALNISLAELRADGQSVLLTTDPQTSGAVYTVTVGEVRDRSEAQNTVQPPNNTGNFTAFTLSPGFLVFEAWNNIGGTAVAGLTSDPRYPNSPDEVRYISSFDTIAAFGTSDYRNNYGARVRGFFVPPTSGNWIFYLRSDDASELWLNPTGTDPAGKVKIQEELACCGPFSAHASAPQALIAGQAYFIEGIYKEGGGGDYIQVAAKLESDSTPPNGLQPISSGSLAIYADATGASVQITQQPVDSQTVCINPLAPPTDPAPAATFTVAASVTPENATTAIQWQRNNGSGWSDIGGATGATYSFNPSLADDGARFRAKVYIPGANATSSESALTVMQANTAPGFGLSASTVTGTEDSGASSVSGLATDIKAHSIPRTPVAFETAFDNANGWQLFGSAAVADGILKLTTPVGSLFGAARLAAPLQTYESIEASWKNRIGGGNGADGMSLSLGEDLANSFTGEEGTGSGLIVSIDTFDNGAALDPMMTGLEMKWRGDIVAYHTIPKDNDGSGNYLRKDTFVDADLSVTPAGLVTFNYDGNSINYQIQNYAGLRANGLIFGARTGGAHDNHWVDDFSIEAFPYDTSSAEAGQTVSFTTSNNNPALFSAQPAISSDGTLTFTGAANACGQATVTVTASDNGGTDCNGNNTSGAQTFVIDIACVNDAPAANNQTVNTTTEQPTPITLTGSDVDNDPLTFAVASNPSNGTLSTDGSGNLIYTSNPGYSGPDSFTFTASDGQATSAPATVSINVVHNSRPNCVASAGTGCSLSIGEDTSKQYIVSVNGQSACTVLDGSGSTDADGDALQITWVIDGTNTVAGTQVPVCLELGCHMIDMIASDGKISCRKTIEVCVITPADGIDQIVALVEGTDVGRKNKQPLIATLKAAAASYEREGHIHTAANQLNAFQNKVRAQIARNNPAEAALFVQAAIDLVEAIACSLELSEE